MKNFSSGFKIYKRYFTKFASIDENISVCLYEYTALGQNSVPTKCHNGLQGQIVYI